MLTLTHTAAGGTLLDGTTRGDGTAAVLRGVTGRWRWSRSLGSWYVQRSRDSRPDRRIIDGTAAALKAAGHTVTVDVDDAARATADVVADRRERAADRADALDARAERKAGEARHHREASDAITDHIPMGQPILVGHHSERRHRRALDRAHRLDEKGWTAGAEARDAARRADIARRAAEGREARSTVENRVKKAAADVARDLRTLHGYFRRWGESHDVDRDPTSGRYVYVPRPVDPDSDRGRDLCARIVENTDRRAYWAEVLAGMPAPLKPAKAARGDLITAEWGDTYTAVRSSKWDVTVANPGPGDPRRTLRIPWCRVARWDRVAEGVR